MRFTSLGSGSEGNALVVEAGRTRVLVDCGFGLRELERRLARAGLEAGQLSAVLVTHEHSDHLGGVARLARRHGVPVHLSWGTLAFLDEDARPLAVPLDSQTPFELGDLLVTPFPVPHDAREPVQFVLSDGAARLGVLTDIGSATPHVLRVLSGCDALVLECNHDAEMLRDGPYPPPLKRRVGSRLGHLSNEAAAGILAGIDRGRLRHLVAAHLSTTNNRPELARAALARVLGCGAEEVLVADQESGFDWLTCD